MSNGLLNLHLDPNLFSAAIQYTSAQTGFTDKLIEKDYYCSVVLHYLSNWPIGPLIFKGGTLLAKVHAGFYRLSEDLDFSLPISQNATRKKRSDLVKILKPIVHGIGKTLNGVSIVHELKGSNESRQYNAELSYNSILEGGKGIILFEIGLREELVDPFVSERINTLIIDPFTKSPIVSPFAFPCLDKNEAYAEKIRAALTREKLAIRDFYDLYYARQNNIINFTKSSFVALVKRKLSLPGADVVNFDDTHISFLERKVDVELMPTLNRNKNDEFDVREVIEWLKDFKRNYLMEI